MGCVLFVGGGSFINVTGAIGTIRDINGISGIDDR
jgi:hypothetical protein